MNKFFGLLAVALLLCGGLSAEEQDDLLHPAKVGLTAGVGLRLFTAQALPLAEDVWAGITFHIVPAIALRPSITFYTLGEDIVDNLTPSNSTTSEDGGLGVALGAFYYSRPKHGLMLYLGPEGKLFLSSEMDFFNNGDKKSDKTYRRLSVAALIGAQYMFSDRFGFQADAGVGMFHYSEHYKIWTAAGVKTTDRETTETTFFVRPAYLGAVFYFN